MMVGNQFHVDETVDTDTRKVFRLQRETATERKYSSARKNARHVCVCVYVCVSRFRLLSTLSWAYTISLILDTVPKPSWSRSSRVPHTVTVSWIIVQSGIDHRQWTTFSLTTGPWPCRDTKRHGPSPHNNSLPVIIIVIIIVFRAPPGLQRLVATMTLQGSLLSKQLPVAVLDFDLSTTRCQRKTWRQGTISDNFDKLR